MRVKQKCQYCCCTTPEFSFLYIDVRYGKWILYFTRGFINIYIYIYTYSNLLLSTISDNEEVDDDDDAECEECVAARRAAPMPDPSSVTLRLTCWATSSPKISHNASCKYSLNIVYLVYKLPSMPTTVLLILVSPPRLLPLVMPPLPSLPIFFRIPTMPAAANRAALRVTTSHAFTMSFRTFKGTSGIWEKTPNHTNGSMYRFQVIWWYIWKRDTVSLSLPAVPLSRFWRLLLNQGTHPHAFQPLMVYWNPFNSWKLKDTYKLTSENNKILIQDTRRLLWTRCHFAICVPPHMQLSNGWWMNLSWKKSIKFNKTTLLEGSR